MASTTPTTNVVKWKEDPLREVLKADIEEGRITPAMKPKEAANVRPEYKKMGTKFASRLKGMRSVAANPKNKPQPQKWTQKHPARIQMKWDVYDGILDSSMDVGTAKQTRAIYGRMSNDDFKSRWKSMQEIVKTGKARAQEDTAALKKDRLLHPRPKTNHRGEPEWNESDAKTLLELDVDNNLHLKWQPQELWASRLQYQEFFLDTFRGHLHQELHTRKWRDQWVEGKKDYTICPEPHFEPDVD